MNEIELAKRLRGIEVKARHTLIKIEELRKDLKKEWKGEKDKNE